MFSVQEMFLKNVHINYTSVEIHREILIKTLTGEEGQFVPRICLV